MNNDYILHLLEATAGSSHWCDPNHILTFAKTLIELEREACAKICDMAESSYELEIAFDDTAQSKAQTAERLALEIRSRLA